MASQTLISQAEKMYQSELDTTDYAKSLLDPAVTAMKENIAAQKKITDDLMGQKPIFNIYGVDEKLRPTVTAWLVEQNDKYKNAADVISKIKDTKDPRYTKAVQEMNEVKTAFENLNKDLVGLEAQTSFAFDNKDNLAGGLGGTYHELDMNLFANGQGIYDAIIAQGIGVDGRLSYMSGETSDPNKEKIKTLSTKLEGIEDETSAEYINISNEITELKKADKVGIIKKIKDYKGHPTHNTDNVSLLLAAQDAVIKAATSGVKWNPDKVGVAVDQIINKLKPDGVRDLMFKYETHINGYIENKFGFKKGTSEFENKKEELRKEDLTDEFREHFTRVLKDDHDENFTRSSKITKNITNSGRFADGKSIRAEGLNVWVPYSTAKKMYDQIVLANDGKAAAFTLNKGKYTYDPKTKNWSGTKDGKTVNYGSSDKLRQSLGINDSTFTALTAAVDTKSDLSDFKNLSAKLDFTKSDQSWRTTTKKYGGGMYGPRSGTQNIKIGNVLAALEAYDGNIKTVRDLETILGQVENDDNMRKAIMGFINNDYDKIYNINDKFLDDMIKDVINAIKKSGYTEPTATATATTAADFS